jgi:hypothetical protein
MRIEMFFEEIWPCIQETNDYLCAQRATQSSEGITAGLNFSIILGAACFLEGVLESFLRAILDCRRQEFNRNEIADFETRRAVNSYYNRLEVDLSERIGRSIGASGYSETFELVFGEPLTSLRDIAPLWEGITVLFNFRNVLGHGRRVFAQRFRPRRPEDGATEDFSGSYRVVESYLLKTRLMNERFMDAHSEYIFLSNAIADHFWELAKQVPPAMLRSLPDPERDACRRRIEE